MALTKEQREILADVLLETDDDRFDDLVRLELEPHSRTVRLVWEDFDDEDFRLLQAASSGGSRS